MNSTASEYAAGSRVALRVQKAESGVVENKKLAIWSIIGASSGNLVEWYDFYAYAFASIYFAPAFFPEGDQTSQLLKTAGIFGAGFLMRPLGGWLFGYLADRHGRRTSMLISVLLMSLGSLLLALMPDVHTVGNLAPLLLMCVRMLQGLSVGGEYGASATYMSEIAPSGKRGFYASFQYMTLIGGQLLAALVLVVLTTYLSSQQMTDWGWRIPFALGALGAVVALFLRRTLVETTTIASRQQQESGSLRALLRYPWACMAVVGFSGAGSLVFYSFTTYMQKYLTNSAPFSKAQASQMMMVALCVFMLLQPLFGMLSDRIGRRNCMLAFALWSMVMTVPLMTMIGSCQETVKATLMIILALTGISFYTAISGIVKAELFPIEFRALGVGFCYSIGNAIFGGSAESVALYLKKIGYEEAYFWYVSVMAGVFFLISLGLPEGKGDGLLAATGHQRVLTNLD